MTSFVRAALHFSILLCCHDGDRRQTVSQDTINVLRIRIYPWGVLQENKVNTAGGVVVYTLFYVHHSTTHINDT
jgi:hypothetical protein